MSRYTETLVAGAPDYCPALDNLRREIVRLSQAGLTCRDVSELLAEAREART